MICGNCRYTGKMNCEHVPAKVKCIITGKYNYYSDNCSCEKDRLTKEVVDAQLANTTAFTSLPDDFTFPDRTVASEYKSSEYKFGKMPVYEEDFLTGYGTDCLVCGESVIVSIHENGPRLCPTCKKAVMFIKDKFKEELNTYEV